MNPGNFSAELVAKIDRSLIERSLGQGRPKLNLVAVAVTLMAIVATGRHVHREESRTSAPAIMQRTSSVPLITPSMYGLEAQQVEYLLHRDLGAKRVEVDTGHGGLYFL